MKLKPLILLILFTAQLFPNMGITATCCQEYVQLSEANDTQVHLCCLDDNSDEDPFIPSGENDCCGDDCHCIASGPNFTLDDQAQYHDSKTSFITDQNHLYMKMIGNNYIDCLLHPPKA